MDTKTKTLNKILEARENRASLRINFAGKGYNSLSLSLNIPGYPKSNDLVSSFFKEVLNDLKIYLEANRIQIINKEELKITDEAGDFYITSIPFQRADIEHIKQVTERFEESYKLGRLIDVDIFNVDAQPVSSGKKKLCYYCGKHSAISCMREKRHTYKEIRGKIFADVQMYLEDSKKKRFVRKISMLALKALLYEVSLTPKPGLVDFENSGSHSDMNYFTFLNSSAALSAYFRDFCLLGYNFSGNYKEILPKIRQIGLQTEKAMFEATGNVNTQKGLIFLFGICLFSISKIYSENIKFTDAEFRKIVKKITKNIVKNELNSSTNNKTHGEKVFGKFGTIGTGVRYEVENAFPTIFETALPYFNENLNHKIYKNSDKLQEILQTGLLKIMSQNNDTNILYRSNLETLNFVKKSAKKAVKNIEEFKNLCEYCKVKNISPGGSADLLAVSLLIHFAKTTL